MGPVWGYFGVLLFYLLDLALLSLASASMEKSASKSAQLDIDQAILDYLLYTTIKALLNDYKLARSHGDDGSVKQEAKSLLCLQMVECRSLWVRFTLMSLTIPSVPPHVPFHASRAPRHS